MIRPLFLKFGKKRECKPSGKHHHEKRVVRENGEGKTTRTGAE